MVFMDVFCRTAFILSNANKHPTGTFLRNTEKNFSNFKKVHIRFYSPPVEFPKGGGVKNLNEVAASFTMKI